MTMGMEPVRLAGIDLSAASWVTVFLLGFFLIETSILLIMYWEYMLDHPGQDEAYILKEVNNYSSKALTFASLTFAGLTFVLAQFFDSDIDVIEGTLFLFTIAFGLFVISYKLEVFAATRRILFSVQQRLFNYGILFVVAGLMTFFYNISIQLTIIVSMIGLLMFILHLLEYVDDFIGYSDEVGDSSYQSKLSDYRND